MGKHKELEIELEEAALMYSKEQALKEASCLELIEAFCSKGGINPITFVPFLQRTFERFGLVVPLDSK